MNRLFDFKELVVANKIHHSWVDVLAEQLEAIENISTKLAQVNKIDKVLPEADNVFRILEKPLGSYRVIIVGQDPYPTPGHAIGLAFACSRENKMLPRSLQNIYAELYDDLLISPVRHGDLSAWHNNGVMLINRVLTVSAGNANSHKNYGWQKITNAIIEASLILPKKPIMVLWGRSAQELFIMAKKHGVKVVHSAHPSPLSARKGFFGSKPFSKVNKLLVASGQEEIDWRL